MAARRRGVRGHGVHMSGVPPLALGRLLRGFHRVQSEQMDDGPLRLHGHVVKALSVLYRRHRGPLYCTKYFTSMLTRELPLLLHAWRVGNVP